MKKIVLGLVALVLLSACGAPVVMTATPLPVTPTLVPSATPLPTAPPVPTAAPALTSSAPVTGCTQSEAASAIEGLAKGVDTFATESNNAIQSAMAASSKRQGYRDAAGLIFATTQQLSVSDCARPAYNATLAYMQNSLDLIDAISPAGKLDNSDKWVTENEAANAAMKSELKTLATIAGVSITGLTP
jgi:hypothetical protein